MSWNFSNNFTVKSFEHVQAQINTLTEIISIQNNEIKTLLSELKNTQLTNQDIKNSISSILLGSQELNSDNEMVWYDTDGNVIAKFKLYNRFNKPSIENIVKRERIDTN